LKESVLNEQPPELHRLADDFPLLVWRLGRPQRCASSALLGGGMGDRRWIVNAQVPIGYDRVDPEVHLAALARAVGCEGAGVGLLTAADVTRYGAGQEEGVSAVATVGLGMVTWAADEDGSWSPWRPGTINLVAFVPVPLSDAALVNSIITVTEAKTQALLDAAVPGTGTASDAACVCCPTHQRGQEAETFGGPRSAWGARLARAAYRAVTAGIVRLEPGGRGTAPFSEPGASTAAPRGGPTRPV
jgi:adenosylcobinamide amidohydrolase